MTGVINIPALGRPFHLGMLYDSRNDQLIPGLSMWSKETLANTDQYPFARCDFQILPSDSFSEKFDFLQVDASLKASVLCGLVEVHGAADYINDKKSVRQARVTFPYKTTTMFQELTMQQLGTGNIEHREVLEIVLEKYLATHVVTGILYGAQFFFVFDQQVSEGESVQDIQGNLKAAVKKMPLVVGEHFLKNVPGKEKMENVSCTFHGDYLLKKPTTFEEAVRVYQGLPMLLGREAKNAVPLTVFLLPLCALDSRAAKLIRQISVRLVTEIENVMEEFAELKVWCNDVLKSPAAQNFPHILKNIKTFKSLCGEFKVELQRTLAKMLPLIRGGAEEETALADVLKKAAESPFNRNKLKQWMNEKDKDINTIQIIMKQMDSTDFFFPENALRDKMYGSEKALEGLSRSEPFLRELQRYLEEQRKWSRPFTFRDPTAGPLRRADPSPSPGPGPHTDPSPSPQSDPKTKLVSVWCDFIQNVSDPLLNQLLDRLLQEKVLSFEEMEAAQVKVRAQKARDLLGTVIKKGRKASLILIREYCEVDPLSELCERLQSTPDL